MNIIALFDEAFLQALGWTLVHSLWQIVLVGILLRFGLWLFRNHSPAIRHNLLFAGIITIFLVSVFTFYILYVPVAPDQNALAFSSQINQADQLQMIRVSESPVIAFDLSVLSKIKLYLKQNIHLVSIFWLIGFIVFAIRFAGGYWYLARVKRKETFPAGSSIQKISNDIRLRFNLKKYVMILESARVKVPIALGYLKPMIILPAGLATSVPFNQLEAILAHELAHIKRNDFLSNLLKSVMEAIFFYHPVFWWISAQIDNEREHCCDDLTLSVCENEKSLQEALLNIELHNQKLRQVAVALYKNKFQLLNRIKRMKTKNHLIHGNHNSIGGWMMMPVLVIIFGLASAFVPRTTDLLNINFQNNPAVPTNSAINNALPVPESTVAGVENEIQPVESEPVQVDNPVATPDTTKVKYGNKIKTDDGYVLLEFDENMNLQQITKDGKELTGEEREKYEKIAEKSKKAYDAEINQKEKEKELQELQDQLQKVQEKMSQVKDEYNEIMKSYMEKAAGADDSSWPDLYADAFDLATIAQLKTLENIHFEMPDYEVPELPGIEMPELPEIYFNEQELMEKIQQSQEMYKEAMRNYEFQRDGDRSEREMAEMAREHERNARQLEREARDMARDARVMELESQRLENGLKKELLNDGLIENWDDLMNFSLSEKKLEVNGEKQSKEMREKYLKLYEELTGKTLESKVEINKD